MKHHERIERLRDAAEGLGSPISLRAARGILAHMDWVISHTSQTNLTAITDPSAAFRLHAVDSIAGLLDLAQAPQGAFCDIGTGGGFPGVPLALASGREATLLESVQKKAVALANFLGSAGFCQPISVAAVRSEALAASAPESFAAVVARAVAPLPTLLELARPLLPAGGMLVAYKGPDPDEEVNAARAATERLGFSLVGKREYALPGGPERRTLLRYEVTADSSVELPRRPGMAAKRPIA